MPGPGIIACFLGSALLSLLVTRSAGSPPRDLEMSVMEESPAGTIVGRLDPRPGYSYAFQDPTDMFEVSRSGVVRTVKVIDREALPNPVIRLSLVGNSDDLPGRQPSFSLVITVLDINDNIPVFHGDGAREKILFHEDVREGRKSVSIATDRDEGANGLIERYDIVSGNEAGMFGIDLSGLPSILYIVKRRGESFDRELRDHYQLNISARDSGVPPKYGFLVVDVTILDVNDNAPSFEFSEFVSQINESAPVGESVFVALALDRDAGLNGEVIYRLEDGTHQFGIDEDTGVVSTLTSPLRCSRRCERSTTRCTPNSCSLLVEASDKGLNALTGRAYLYVEVLDENDHDPVIAFSRDGVLVTSAYVGENAGNQTSVFSVGVSDLDKGINGETTLRIIHGNEEGYFFHLSLPSYGLNEVQVARQLDRETIDHFNLTFQAVDKGKPPRSSTAFIIVTVADANDHAPEFEHVTYRVSLSEWTKPHSFVANIRAADRDEGINSQLRYEIASHAEGGNWFSIDSVTGLVTTTDRLDREQLAQVVLNVTAHDGGSDPKCSSTILLIYILDENDNPPQFDLVTCVAELLENSSPGTEIAALKALDLDSGDKGTVEYLIHYDTKMRYPNVFDVNPTTGAVTALQAFDREATSHYVIKVVARDKGSQPLSATATVELTITDVNDHRPKFSAKELFVNVLESAPVGHQVGQVYAADKDSGSAGHVRYSMTDRCNSFQVDAESGVITTNVKMTQQICHLTVQAIDGGGLQADDDAVVHVIITSALKGSHALRWPPQNLEITEDDGGLLPQAGRLVGTIESPSKTGAFTYTIGGGDPSGVFFIDATGAIMAQDVVDREARSEYNLTVVGYDGVDVSTRQVLVTVRDLNDNAPVFHCQTTEVTILENWPAGRSIFLANAVDADSGVNQDIRYDMSSHDDAKNVFAVDSTSGMIYLTRSPTHLADTWVTLTVTATDGGAQARSTSLSVRVRVDDVNDHTPVFSRSRYDLVLSESQSVNNIFIVLSALDSDSGTNGETVFAILKGNGDGRFGLFPDGSLFVARPVDREVKDMYLLTIVARDSGSEPRSSSVNVTIFLEDENDNWPMFTREVYEFVIKENRPPGTLVGAVSATDLDVGRNSVIKYSLLGDNNFSIDSSTGIIVSKCQLDRENLLRAHFLLEVTAADGGIRERQSKVTVKVTVQDENDNPPVFMQAPGTVVAVSEHSGINDVVFTLLATDPDDLEHSAVSYSIEGGNEDGKFGLHAVSGQLYLKEKLDREVKDKYMLKIKATDNGDDIQLEALTYIHVSVLDYNDNAPQFGPGTHTSVTVSETTPVGETLVTFSGSDEDEDNNAKLRYDIVSGNEDLFSLDVYSGKLALLQSLDYESTLFTSKEHVLNISLSDSGFPSLSVTILFIVKVTDANDNSPEFTDGLSKVYAKENKRKGSKIADLSAADKDSGDLGTVRYTIRQQTPTGDYFTINEVTGEITVSTYLDREQVDAFQVLIHAIDQDPIITQRRTAEKSISIIVEDVNDNHPVFQSASVFLVPSSLSVGSEVAAVWASDLDHGDNSKVHYSVSGVASTLFTIDSLEGKIYLARDLPVGPINHTLTVTATDGGKDDILGTKSTTMSVLLLVHGDGKGPSFSRSSPTSASVTENVASGTRVLQVKATCPTCSPVEYYVTNVTASDKTHGVVFSVNRLTGEVVTVTFLDRELLSSDVFQVDVSAVHVDEGGRLHVTTTQVTITVEDKNDNPPVFSSSLFAVSVSELVSLGTALAWVHVTDPDTTGRLVLSLEGDDSDNFGVMQNGTLYVKQTLDHEVKPSLNFSVVARDGVAQSSALVYVSVVDENDNWPVFSETSYYFDVPENAEIGHTVGRILATDRDSGSNGHVVYEFASKWGQEEFLLGAKRGALVLKRQLDYEERQLYVLKVKARDEAVQSKVTEVKVYVNVKDVNDNSPKFSMGSYSGKITEDSPAGTDVVTVTATDLDWGLNGDVRYSLFGAASSFFGVGPINGTVYTKGHPDKDGLPIHVLVVMATDQAPGYKDRMSATATVEVELVSAQEPPLIFLSPDTIHVKEDAKIGSQILAVAVQKKDQSGNKQVSFRCLSHSGPGNVVSIDAMSGVLVLDSQLDRESVASYTLIIEASLNGSSPDTAQQILVIKVIDVNDNAPLFSQKLYKKIVAEDVPVGTVLLAVQAMDVDESFNGAVKYFLVDGNGSQDFHLDMYSGVLRVHKPLDYERARAYSLVVQAEDSSLHEKSISSNATIIITVTDVNDCSPVFDDSPFVAFVQEGMPEGPVLVVTVTARDEDTGDFGQVQYRLRDINSHDHMFEVDGNTGEVFVLKALDREVTPVYVLMVMAIDNGNPGRMGTATVTVSVMDVNDHAPVFASLGFNEVHVLENQPPGTGLVNVSATDRDEGVNSQVVYSLLNISSSPFTIEPHSGRIQTTSSLDRELTPVHYLTVVATDLGLPPKSSSIQVTVFVDDDNDHAPEFDASSYTATIGGCSNVVDYVVGLMAADGDTGNNGKVFYALESHDESYFQINRESGVVTTTKPFRHLTWPHRRFTFTARASDLGEHPLNSTTSVVVSVSNTSATNCPKFRHISSSPRVLENAEIGSAVATVQVRPSSSRVSYHIAGGNINQAFVVDPDSGAVTVAGKIDFEVTQKFNLWLEAKVQGSTQLSSFYQLTVTVLDENDNPPIFPNSLFTAEIDENCPVGTSVLQVLATDLDSGKNQQIVYAIKSGNENGTFAVNRSTGHVTTINSVVDRERISSFLLEIEACDMGLPVQSATASVQILLRDVNDNQPTFIGPRSVAVPEDLPKDSFIMQLTTSDLDIESNAQVTFSFESTVDKSLPFAVDARSGVITNTQELDAEAESRYSFRVTATDGAFIQKTHLIIRVLDVNDNPPNFQNSVLLFNFTEQQPAKTKVAQLSALDLDKSSPNNKFYFSLKQPSSFFELDSETGELVAMETMHFSWRSPEVQTINDHVLYVLVTDLGVPALSSVATLVIQVSDANDHAPVFTTTHYFSAVPGNFPASTKIMQVTAEDKMDADRNADVMYEVLSGTGMSLFSIIPSSGEIYSNVSLAGKENQRFVLVVKARDSGSPVMSSTATVELYVTAANMHPPRFNNNTFWKQVSEDVAEGYVIDTVIAIDTDKGLNGQIVYNITAGNDGGLFSIGPSDGVLKVEGKLDFEAKASHTVSISARDRAYFYKEVTQDYHITLLDANDNKPVFVQDYYDAYIKENSELHGPLLTVSATDADTSPRHAEICYSVSEDTHSGVLFQINQTSGAITFRNGRFDLELRAMYTLSVEAFNPGQENCQSPVLVSKTSVFVHVLGQNEHRPQFLHRNYTLELSESAEVGTSVGQVQAEDKDAGRDGVVFYYLQGESNLMGFLLEPVTGVLRVSRKADFETLPFVALTAIAKNWDSVQGNDTDTCVINIVVSDANDPPEFSQAVYHVNISENAGSHTFVTDLEATDYDLRAENQGFFYEIISGNEGEFEVTSSGRVHTTGVGTLDRESKARHVIVVGARDSHRPDIIGLATVEIQLVDVNDNGPRLSLEELRVNVTENAPVGQEVILLKDFTTDDDLPPNQGPYNYKMVPGPWADFFSIEKVTGCVRTKQVLNRDTHPHLILPVVVTDNGRPRLTSTLTVTVFVKDMPSIPPNPKIARVIVSRLEDETRLDTVADVSPPYPGPRNRFNCRILDGNDSPFFISQGCSLSVGAVLPTSTYNLRIQASSSKSPAMEYNITVEVETITNGALVNSVAVVLRNEQASSFLEKKYFTFIRQVQEAFGTHFTCKVYSLKQAGTRLLVMLYVLDMEHGLLSYQDIKRGLSNAKTGVEIRADVSIETVAASLCDDNPCLNGGKCTTNILLTGGTSIFESSSLTLNVPNTDLGTSCSCSPVYTGPYCNQRQQLCGASYCSRGGVCVNGTCHCSAQWRGGYCELDVDECKTVAPCKNGAACQNTKGSFKCHCTQGYQGIHCDTQSFCSLRPCSEHGTCKELHDSFHCICDFGFYGAACQFSSKSFAKGSYAQFLPLNVSHIYNITMHFATVEAKALLLFSPVALGGGEAGFLAIEIVNSRVKVTFLLESQSSEASSPAVDMTLTDPVNNGDWHRLDFVKAFGVARLLVHSCPDSECGPCTDHRPGCYTETTYGSENYNAQSRYISVGGIRDFQDILEHKGLVSTHTFQGCLHSVAVNGILLGMDGPPERGTIPQDMHAVTDKCPRKQPGDLCSDGEHVCHNNGACVDRWSHVTCRCPPGYMGDFCLAKKQPFSLKSNAIIRYSLQSSYVREQQLVAIVSDSSRPRRSLGDTSLTLRFRTRSGQGHLISSRTGSVSSELWLADKGVHFLVQSGDKGDDLLSVESEMVADGTWHNVTVRGSGTTWRLDVDGQNVSTRNFQHSFDFASLDIVEMVVGGWMALSSVQAIAGFDGCLSLLLINGELLPLNGSSDKYEIKIEGEVEGTCGALCEDNPCGGVNRCVVEGEGYQCFMVDISSAGLETGFLIVLVLFVLLIIFIVAVFVLFHMHRDLFHICGFSKKYSHGGVDQTVKRRICGDGIIPSSGSSSSSGMSVHSASPQDEETIIQRHITQGLLGNNGGSGSCHLTEPCEPHETLHLLAGDLAHQADSPDSFPEEDLVLQHYHFDNSSRAAVSDTPSSNVARHCHLSQHHHHHHQHQPQAANRGFKIPKYNQKSSNTSKYKMIPNSEPHESHIKQIPLASKETASQRHAQQNPTTAASNQCQSLILEAANQAKVLHNCRSGQALRQQKHPQILRRSYSSHNSPLESTDSHPSFSSTYRTLVSPTSLHRPSKLADDQPTSPSRHHALARQTVRDARRSCSHPDLIDQMNTMHFASPQCGSHHRPNHQPDLANMLELDSFDISSPSSDDSDKSDSFTCSEFEYENDIVRSQFEAGHGRSKFEAGHGRSKFEAGLGRSQFEAGCSRSQFEAGHGRSHFEADAGRSQFEADIVRSQIEADIVRSHLEADIISSQLEADIVRSQIEAEQEHIMFLKLTEVDSEREDTIPHDLSKERQPGNLDCGVMCDRDEYV